MPSDTEFKSKGLAGARPTKALELVDYQEGAVVSRELVKKPNCTVMVYALDTGLGLNENISPFNALVQVLEGEAVIMIAGHHHRLHAGGLILAPANQPHALKAIKRAKLLLTMIRS